MSTAVIFYHSKTGTTRQYARQIGDYLTAKDVDVTLASIAEYREEMLDEVDYLFLGCWTSGLFVILQHPEKAWVDFAKSLPALPDTKVVLFTTYMLLTGSMFRNMAKHLTGRFNPSLELKSRNGMFSEEDRLALDRFIR